MTDHRFNPIAHAIQDPDWRIHKLDEHLQDVASIASGFVAGQPWAKWVELAGRWHDLGKYSNEFQERIRIGTNYDVDCHLEGKTAQRVDHSTAGAQHAVNVFDLFGWPLAYAIAGHHGGLLNGDNNGGGDLAHRLAKDICDWRSYAPEALLQAEKSYAFPFEFTRQNPGFGLSFFTRVIFSCLVDADFLDTEHFFSPHKRNWRQTSCDLRTMNEALDLALSQKMEGAAPSAINHRRAEILRACQQKALHPPGLFTLTVPTGGGKTLSSLSFALRHAIQHKRKRIIYVIPYTSIIEQNAAIFRDILGEEAVLEHHCNFEPKSEDYRSRLAAENWDAPLIVTTSVQFFESLFAAKTSRSRKLHNILDSVVILDEAQMLPPPLLIPCMEVLRELTSWYGTSIVLCTATQPALSGPAFKKAKGLRADREIIEQPNELYDALKRVSVQSVGELSDSDLAEHIQSHQQVLCIVNSRRHARELYLSIHEGSGSNLHLSALMCPAHRSERLQSVRQRLLAKQPCRLISTSLIEAGVDISFPCVYRAIAGVDSIAQAAGRCNRENELSAGGRVFVFEPEQGIHPGFREQTDAARDILRQFNDPLSLDAVEAYFDRLFWSRGEESLDQHQIMPKLSAERKPHYNFREVADLFRFIDSDTTPVIVPYDATASRLIDELRDAEFTGTIARRLQRYSVSLYAYQLDRLDEYHAIEWLHDGQFAILARRELYHRDYGLNADDPSSINVDACII